MLLGTEYIKGATDGVPEAIQVADRWHLLKNLHETLERYLDRDQACLKAAAEKEPDVAKIEPSNSNFQLQAAITPEKPNPEAEISPPTPLTKAQQDKLARRTKHLAL